MQSAKRHKILVDGVSSDDPLVDPIVEPTVEPIVSDPIVESVRVCSKPETENDPNKYFPPTALDEYVWKEDGSYRQALQFSKVQFIYLISCFSCLTMYAHTSA